MAAYQRADLAERKTAHGLLGDAIRTWLTLRLRAEYRLPYLGMHLQDHGFVVLSRHMSLALEGLVHRRARLSLDDAPRHVDIDI